MRGKLILLAAMALAVLALLGSLEPKPSSRPKHELIISTSPTQPFELVAHKVISNTGRRLTIGVDRDINRNQCLALLEYYTPRVQWRGQVAVRKPDDFGKLTPWCVDNRDGSEVIFNDEFFQ